MRAIGSFQSLETVRLLFFMCWVGPARAQAQDTDEEPLLKLVPTPTYLQGPG